MPGRQEECSSVTWRFLPARGTETCLLHRVGSGWGLGGYLVREEGGPWQIGYRVFCDAGWMTREADIAWRHDATPGTCRLVHDGAGNWHVNGEAAPWLRGCMDVDLGFSPATNTLPIRRLLHSGHWDGNVTAAWLRFPAMTVERLEQGYEKSGVDRWHYWSATGFETHIEVNWAGLVTRYPDLWEAWQRDVQ